MHDSFLILLWLTKSDPFNLEFRMKMNENGLNDKWTENEWLEQGEHTVGAWWALYEWWTQMEGSGECKWTHSSWWTHIKIG